MAANQQAAFDRAGSPLRRPVTCGAHRRLRGPPADLRHTLRSTEETEALKIVEDVVASALATVLQTTPDRIDAASRFDELGLESLMAAELSALLQHRLDCVVPPMELTTGAGIRPVARRILGRIQRHP